jgi:hypothetical protein
MSDVASRAHEPVASSGNPRQVNRYIRAILSLLLLASSLAFATSATAEGPVTLILKARGYDPEVVSAADAAEQALYEVVPHCWTVWQLG